MGNKALLNRIEKIENLKAEIEALQNEVNALQDAIKSDMESKNVDTIEVGDYTVRYKEVSTSRFDSTTFKKAYKSLYNQYLKTTVSKRFTIA